MSSLPCYSEILPVQDALGSVASQPVVSSLNSHTVYLNKDTKFFMALRFYCILLIFVYLLIPKRFGGSWDKNTTSYNSVFLTHLGKYLHIYIYANDYHQSKVATAAQPGVWRESKTSLLTSTLIFTENRNHILHINCFTRLIDFKFTSKCSGPFNYSI